MPTGYTIRYTDLPRYFVLLEPQIALVGLSRMEYTIVAKAV